MVPNKFDNHIKNLMENREIQPSNQAWSKLSNRIDEDQKPNRNKWFWLSGLAASLVGVLIMVNVFNASAEKTPTLVETNINEDLKTDLKTTESIKIEVPKIEDVSEENQLVEISEVKSTLTNKRKNNYRVESPSTKNKAATLINANQNSQNDLALNDATKTEDFKVNTTKVEDIKIISTIDETDKLLSEALLAVTTPKTETIDAASLLYDAEVEVEQTFRTKMFAKIKENVSTLTTAIVERNK